MTQSTFTPAFIFYICIISLVITILGIASMWRVYQKAGQPGWAVIIPIYSTLVLLRIIAKPWWWILLMLIPFVDIVFAIWSVNLLSKCFGKGTGFTLGLIFLPFIFCPILGFGNAVYSKPAGENTAQV